MKIKNSMKNLNIKSLLIIPFVALLTGCANSDDYGTPNLSGECIDLPVTKQVQEITALSTAIYQQYTGDDVIEAYVTSSDEGGNFYKTISLMSVDGAVGFSMPADDYNLFNKYEPGRKVFVKMKDRYFVTDHSSTIIGSLYNNDTPDVATDDEVGRMSRSEYQDVIFRSCEKVNEDEIVKHLTIAQAKNNQYLNMLIEFDNVQFANASNGKTFYDATLNSIGGATNHNITDVEGNTLILRVSEFATFAANMTPTGSGKIRGVLTKFNNDFQFMIRTINDVKIDGPRLESFFSEDFESITATGNNQFINLPGWLNVSVNGGAEKWEARIFSNNKYAKFSSFGITPAENNVNAQLITPAINLDNTTNETLVFGTVDRFYNGEVLQVLISEDFDGTPAGISTATWTVLPAVISTGHTGSTSGAFVSSGLIDISAYSGNVHIAFKYVGATNGISTEIQVDNIKIYGGQ